MGRNRWLEFFEGDNRRLSMTRLLMFLAFFPATAVTVWLHTEGALGVFLGAFVTGYVLGKGADIGTRYVKGKADARMAAE